MKYIIYKEIKEKSSFSNINFIFVVVEIMLIKFDSIILNEYNKNVI